MFDFTGAFIGIELPLADPTFADLLKFGPVNDPPALFFNSLFSFFCCSIILC